MYSRLCALSSIGFLRGLGVFSVLLLLLCTAFTLCFAYYLFVVMNYTSRCFPYFLVVCTWVARRTIDTGRICRQPV